MSLDVIIRVYESYNYTDAIISCADKETEALAQGFRVKRFQAFESITEGNYGNSRSLAALKAYESL